MTRNTADASSIESHLLECDGRFHSPLSSRLDISEYAGKLACLSDRFEAWSEGRLVGLLAIYLNNRQTEIGFISNVSVSPGLARKGLGSKLMEKCLTEARGKGFKILELEVADEDASAIKYYQKFGFEILGASQNGFFRMRLNILSL